jgi:hypothetical protein
VASVALPDPRGELHPAEVSIVRVGHGHGHVAQHGARHRRVDALDEAGRVEDRGRLEAPRDAEADRAALHRGLPRHRGLDDAVRGRPELELTVGECQRRRHRHLAHHVPGVVAADDGDHLVLTADVRAATSGRLERPRAEHVIAKRSRLVVHDADEAPHVELRPRVARDVGLSGQEGDSAALDLDRLETACAERPGGRLERRAAVLRVTGDRREHQDGGQQKHQRTHFRPPLAFA